MEPSLGIYPEEYAFGYHMVVNDEMRFALNGATIVVRKEMGYNVAYKKLVASLGGRWLAHGPNTSQRLRETRLLTTSYWW